jgi:hypothetical protein
MTRKLIFSLALVLFVNVLFAQVNLPTIKATSKKVDVRDGDNFMKGDWNITPEAKPDIYTTSSKGKKVTFYTDLDSISVRITTTTKFDFIILLNDTTKALTEIQYKPGYLDILKGSDKYNINDNRPIPKFTYQSMDNQNLVKIRKDFNLDSVAGKGNEIYRILSLMHWVHNIVKHDGSSNNPALRNAIDLIAVCKKENRGVNCRMMATILNECYLSMGIKSRFITCWPKDTTDIDCHVINMVYSNSLNKWIWIDPTFDAYVMNEKGELLGIQEVRERLINGKTIILNPEANWNRQNSQTKEYYIEFYMTKNLYRLRTPVVSEYDTETSRTGKELTFVDLIPFDGTGQTPQKKEETEIGTGMKFTYYKTNNPIIFWTKPE